MRPTAFPAEHIVEHVRHSKVLTMDQIHQQVGCSRMTAWRALRAQGYYTSYNYNASYYTLADIPAFDAQGLWAFRDIRFSCHGTLIQTLMTWIDQSAAGYQAEELSQLLAVPVAPALSRLHARGRVCREKMGGGYSCTCPARASRVRLRSRRVEPNHHRRRPRWSCPIQTESLPCWWN